MDELDHGQPAEPLVGPPERLVPHSIQAEVSVLGAMMIDQAAIGDASDILKPADFYRPAHQEIFAVLLDMALRSIAVDLVTLREELIYRKKLEAIGGAEYIYAIVEGVPDFKNVKYYAGIVRRHARSRDLITMGTKLVADGFDPSEDPVDLIHAAQVTLYELSLACEDVKEDMEIGPAMTKALARVEETHANPEASRIMTGFTDLDNFCGGFQGGEVVMIGARPKAGKTTLACTIAAYVAAAAKTVMIVSAEMPAAQIAKRFIQSQGQVWGSRMRDGSLSEDEWEAVESATEAMTPWKIQLIGKPLTVPQIDIRARQYAAHLARPLDLLVIDYLQIMKPHEGRTIREQIMAMSRDIKQMAVEQNVVVLLLSQLSRPQRDSKGQAKSDEPPSKYDLKESGTLEQDADYVLMLHRPDPQPVPVMDRGDHSMEVWLRVAWARECGDTPWPVAGDLMKPGFRLRWWPGLTLFSDWMNPLNTIPRLQGKPRPPVTERSKYARVAEPIGNFLGRMVHKLGGDDEKNPPE